MVSGAGTRWGAVAGALGGWVAVAAGFNWLGEWFRLSHTGGHLAQAIPGALWCVGLLGLLLRPGRGSGRLARAGLLTGMVGAALVAAGNVGEIFHEEGLFWLLFSVGFLALNLGLIAYGAATRRAGLWPLGGSLPLLTGVIPLLVLPLSGVLAGPLGLDHEQAGGVASVVYGAAWAWWGHAGWHRAGKVEEDPAKEARP